MIIDTDPHTHKQERRYLIYDLIAINQVSLAEVHIDWQLWYKDFTDFLVGSFYKFYS
jgi:mRNA-capping enzyme